MTFLRVTNTVSGNSLSNDVEAAKKKKKEKTIAEKKAKKVFDEWGQGKLHSGSKKGPLVPYSGKKNPQAIAIALSEGRKAQKAARKRKKG